MGGPIQLNGGWWQEQPDGTWVRHDTASNTWVPAPSPYQTPAHPAPAPATPAPRQLQPTPPPDYERSWPTPALQPFSEPKRAAADGLPLGPILKIIGIVAVITVGYFGASQVLGNNSKPGTFERDRISFSYPTTWEQGALTPRGEGEKWEESFSPPRTDEATEVGITLVVFPLPPGSSVPQPRGSVPTTLGGVQAYLNDLPLLGRYTINKATIPTPDAVYVMHCIHTPEWAAEVTAACTQVYETMSIKP